MFTHPEMLAAVARQHVGDLVEEASRDRLATALRRNRRHRGRARPARQKVSAPASTLVSCEVRRAGVAQG